MFDITIFGIRVRIGIEDRVAGRFYGLFVEKAEVWTLDLGVLVYNLY